MQHASSKTTAEQVQSYRDRKKGTVLSPWGAAGMAGEIGYILAIPAVLLGFGGAYLDKYMGTSPFCIIIGFVVAAVSSYMGVRQVIRRLFPEEKTDQKI